MFKIPETKFLETIYVKPIFEALPSVVAIYPSGETIPENLLRFSIEFADPPNEAVLPKIQLQLSDGVFIDEPFLNQELWSPDCRRVTLLLHPGRVKSGLVAHQRLGRAFEVGDILHLTIEGKCIKSWKVELAKTSALQPMQWHLSSLKKNTYSPLQVTFNESIDVGGQELIAVVDSLDRKVAGNTELGVGEKQWIFTPKEVWKDETYHLVIHPLLEDASGNTLGSSFEHSADMRLEKRVPIRLSLMVD